MNRILMALGAAFTVLGAALLLSILLRNPEPAAPPTGPQTVVENQREAQPPSRAWAIVAGLSVALGAGLILIGMNRWTSTANALPPPAASVRASDSPAHESRRP